MKVLARNKKASFDYEILKKYEAGIVLSGQEVKSIKNGRISLKGAYIILRKEEFFLIGANVPPYQPNNAPADYRPDRPRKLLLRKFQIKELIGKSRQKGLTMVPLSVYTKKGKIKVEFALVKGKRKPDKKEELKEREMDRKIRQEMKKRRK